MNILFFFVFYVLLGTPFSGAPGEQQPQLVFDATSISVVPRSKSPDEKIEATFGFRNSSGEMVTIVEVRPSCTCTASDYTRDQVLVKGKGYIKLNTTAGQLKEAKKVDAVIKTIDGKKRKGYYKIELTYGL